MANPSLQIGNSNWAIKESNLLGYSTAGTRFLPQPITMTRASAGTRVNSSGLIETVELLGSELVTSWTNKDFASFASSGSNITQMVSSGSGNNNYSALTITSGKTYKLQFTSSQAITCQIRISANTNLTGASVVLNSLVLGTNEVYFTASSTYAYIGFYAPNSFTDTQISSFTLKEVTQNNLARVNYDGTASSLLVEPQRTNLFTYSQNFTNGNFWDFQGASQIDNSIISPDGTQNADKFYPSSTGNFKGLAKSFGSTLNAAAYTLSAFVKKGGKDFFFFYNLGSPQGSGGVWFNINTGVIGNVGNAYSNVKIENVGNGWFRCSATLNYGGTNDYSYLLMSDSNGSLTATVNGTDGIYLWGTQIEEASYPTSYIPTSGSTVTRVKDQYSKTGISNLINSTEGVFFVEIAAFEGANTDRQISISDGSTSNRVVMAFLSNGTQIQFYVASGGSITVNTTKTIPTITSGTKIAFSYKVNDFKIYSNGVLIASDTNGTVPTGLSVLAFNRGDGNEIFFGKVKQLQVFKTTLTDTELATLTTI